MKILTVAIPCYNSEAYMRKAIDHVVCGGEDVEVLIVDDGSKDGTLEVAREYEARFPGIVRAIHQENKGHGGAVNTGLREATGLYYKVCDSDDWLDYDSFMKALSILKEFTEKGTEVDAFISNYIYDKVGAKHKRTMHYTGFFPEDRIFTWDEMKKPLAADKYVLMHSLIYRTALLREAGLNLPEHTFYVDNLVVFQPMVYVKTLYYLNMTMYHYYIGRADQSVQEQIMIKRLDQQLRVTRMMIDEYRPNLVASTHQLNFLVHYMSIMMTVSSALLLRRGDAEALTEKDDLWTYLKNKDKTLYRKIRNGLLGHACNLKGRVGRRLMLTCYSVAQKLYGFN